MPDSVRATAAALRSRRHAQMLFDAVVDLIGTSGWQETANGGTIQWLFRRDPAEATHVVPWPVLVLTFGSRNVIEIGWSGFGEPAPVTPPVPPPPPKLRGLGPGSISIADGDEHIEIAFNEDGAKFETSRSHHAHPLAGLAPALAATTGNPIELLARFVAQIDASRRGPGRVLLPVPIPGGAAGVWHCGLRAVRRSRFDVGVSNEAGWAVADGLTGRALAFHTSRDGALSAWRDAVAANSPWPEERPIEEPPDDLPEGAMVLRGPTADVPMPDRVPANVPAVLVPVTAMPASPPPFGSWVALLGARGATCFAACRRKRKGFTLLGENVLGRVDPQRIEEAIDRADIVHAARMRDAGADSDGRTRWPWRTTTYRLGDDGRLAFDSSHEGPEWHAGDLNGDVVAHRVVRQLWVP